MNILKIFLLIDWLLAMLGLRFCARAFSSCGKRGPLFIAVRGPLTIVASPAAEHRLQTRRLSICGSRAQLLRGMWDPSRPGLEPVSPALAGRFPTTAPPGKPLWFFFFKHLYWSIIALQWCVSFCFITKWISYTYTICSHFSSLLHLPPSHPPHPTPLGGHKAPSWSPCAMQLLPTSYLWCFLKTA